MNHRALAAFPVLAMAATLCVAAAFGLPAFLLFDDNDTVLGVILAAVGIYLATFAGIFFSVALAGAAAQVLDGQDATVGSGMAVARRNVGAIAGWAASAPARLRRSSRSWTPGCGRRESCAWRRIGSSCSNRASAVTSVPSVRASRPWFGRFRASRTSRRWPVLHPAR